MSCLNNKVDEPPARGTTNAEFLSTLRDSWEAPYDHTSFLKDIPRLVTRMQIQTRDGVMYTPASSVDGESGKVRAVAELVELVSAGLGKEREAASEILSSLNSGQLLRGGTEGCIDRIFRTLQEDGPVIRALKLVHQGVVLYAMSVLKEGILKDIFTKDVRGPEGWQVVLRIGDVIQLEHIRTEQSVEVPPQLQSDNFQLQWMVMVTFDRHLEQLRSCSLRLLALSPAPDMQESRLNFLRNTLIEGLIVL